MTVPVLLTAIVIDADNRVLRISEAGTPRTASLALGTYYLRGDGSADDLCRALKLALEAAGPSANTYTVAVSFTGAPASPSATVTVSIATGTDAFALLWADAATTVAPSWWGFTAANTASSTAAKASTLSPSSCWVGNCAPEKTQPKRSAEAYVFVASSGAVAAGLTGGPYLEWRFDVAFVDGKRFDAAFIAADPDRALSSWWERSVRGSPFEYHLADYASPSSEVTVALSTSTRIGGAWHLHEDSVSDFDGARFDTASSLWSLSTIFRARVT